jgi:hypothetical protein
LAGCVRDVVLDHDIARLDHENSIARNILHRGVLDRDIRAERLIRFRIYVKSAGLNVDSFARRGVVGGHPVDHNVIPGSIGSARFIDDFARIQALG